LIRGIAGPKEFRITMKLKKWPLQGEVGLKLGRTVLDT
jgi:hypothetical protein